jgi:hypothetical protein
MELFVRHLVHESTEAANKFGTSSLNCDFKDGGLFPVDVGRARAFTCFSYAAGERNNGVKVVVLRDRREIEIGIQLGSSIGPLAPEPDVPGLSKPLVKPLAELGVKILDRWDGR